jgi:hypothetical protein
MKLSPEEKKVKLKYLSEIASDLLVEIIDEALPKEKVPTRNDLNFKRVINNIYGLCPALSDSYKVMYNHIQENKIKPESSYVKHIKNNF